MIWGIDIGIKTTGITAGPGDAKPAIGAWSYEDTGGDLHALLSAFRRDLDALAARMGSPTHILYEAPLLTKYDLLLTLRRTYSMGGFLELWGGDHGAVVQEEDPKNLKRFLTGDSYAKKPKIVAAVRGLGLVLPAVGKEDAADSFSCWYRGLQLWAKPQVTAWDQAIHARRGFLV